MPTADSIIVTIHQYVGSMTIGIVLIIAWNGIAEVSRYWTKNYAVIMLTVSYKVQVLSSVLLADTSGYM